MSAVTASNGLCLPASGSLDIGAVGFRADLQHALPMEITGVNIFPSNDERIAAYASITFDDCFVVHGLVLKISKTDGYFLYMPRKKRGDGTYVDLVLPLDTETRRMIEEKVFAEYEKVASKLVC